MVLDGLFDFLNYLLEVFLHFFDLFDNSSSTFKLFGLSDNPLFSLDFVLPFYQHFSYSISFKLTIVLLGHQQLLSFFC